MENLLGGMEEGFGIGSMQDLAELRKALDIGYTLPVSGQFDALRVESLEQTLKLLTFSMTNIRFWSQIPKLDAYSTVEEYNRLTSYGAEGGGFTQSGELPQEEDSTYVRANQLVKFLGTTRSVTHPATLIRTVPADLITQETQNGALWLMGKLNSALYYANADAVPQEFNSVTKQIIDGAGNVIDCLGQPLTKELIEKGAHLVAEGFGQATTFFSNNQVFADFSNYYNQFQRFSAPGGAAGVVGTPVTGVSTTNGQISFQPDVFVKNSLQPPASATNVRAPSPPTLAIGSVTSDATVSLWLSGDAGAYYYKVTAVNQYGESAPTAASSSVAALAAYSQILTVTDGGGTFPATGYKIYQTPKGGANTGAFNLINYTLPRSATSGVYNASTTWKDINQYRAGTYQGLMLDMTVQSLAFKQLSPMIKMNLAVISPAIRWMQLLYGTPIVYAPKKNVVFTNIGTAS